MRCVVDCLPGSTISVSHMWLDSRRSGLGNTETLKNVVRGQFSTSNSRSRSRGAPLGMKTQDDEEVESRSRIRKKYCHEAFDFADLGTVGTQLGAMLCNECTYLGLENPESTVWHSCLD